MSIPNLPKPLIPKSPLVQPLDLRDDRSHDEKDLRVSTGRTDVESRPRQLSPLSMLTSRM